MIFKREREAVEDAATAVAGHSRTLAVVAGLAVVISVIALVVVVSRG